MKQAIENIHDVLFVNDKGEIIMTTETFAHQDLTTVAAVDGESVLVRKADIERIQKEQADMEPVEYELIFSKYPTVDSLAFKQKRLVDYVAWQRDMLRMYTDSFLAGVAGLADADVYCIDNSFDMKAKGKGKLKATFLIKKDGEVVGKHRLVLNKVKETDMHRIIDAHIFLLEMALFGNTADYKNEEGPLHKFCKAINRPELLASTLELLGAIEAMKLDGTIEEKGE